MVPVRKLFLTIASGSVLCSGMANALGLGEITISSALNQPLEAEIELLEVGDLTESEMHIALASPDAFMRAGVDRTMFMDDLRFTTMLRGSKSFIRVVSRKPVREPYLNFIVEVARPNGRLLREYTLLIDPPSGLANRPQTAGFQRDVVPSPSRMQLPVVSTPPLALAGHTYTVVRGDSLWKIARRIQSAGSLVALPDLMADIHDLNPQAFVGGDIDRLISGATLLLSDRASPATSTDAPVAEPVAKSPAESSSTMVQTTQAPEAAPAVAKISATPDVTDVQREFAEVLAVQELESLKLQQQMNDLQSQLTSLREQVSSKDELVQALQVQLDNQSRQPAEIAPAGAAATLPLVAQPESPETQSGWMPIWLASITGGAFLAALAGALLWWSRREPVDPGPERLFVDHVSDQPKAAVVPVRIRETLPVDAVGMSEPLRETKIAAGKPAHSEELDALEGASIYAAYGRLDQAREVLERSLEKDPSRNDVRLRLLELLARMGDSSSFAQQEQLLQAAGGDSAQIERIRSAYPHMSERQSESDSLADIVLDLDTTAQLEASNSLINDTPLNLDDISLDADWVQTNPFAQVLPRKPEKAAQEPAFNSRLELLEVAEIPADTEAFAPFLNFKIKSEAADGLPAGGSDDPFGEDNRHVERNLNHLASNPKSLSRLNMALAYIDQGNLQSACDILNQLISEGDDRQKKQAREILARIA